ncbi:M28 family peptidase [Rhodohalobacter sp.]|uniref:M28 family peptidase n=1 Tax=Rhodohalobacter sp. TaxID=1974210 RepID=UPI002ACD6771|nr:M28 family peptidase [Rhodohalobacter sp.]MDZ7758234.1 M28 family peptidase [Rhodohalobacter sp.]
MKKILLPLLLFATGCATQNSLQEVTSTENLVEFRTQITPQFLQQHLEVIAHDSLEGRATGSDKIEVAANYIADFYSDLGFTPMGDSDTYFQSYRLNAEYTDSLVYETFQINGADTLKHSHSVESSESTGDFIRMFGGSVPQEGDVVFAGFGVNDNERGVQHLAGEEIQGNWVMIFEEIPYVVEGDTLINPDITSNSRLRNILVEMDAAGILLISDYSQSEFQKVAEMSSESMGEPSNISLAYLEQNGQSGFPKGFLQISPEMAVTYLGLSSTDELDEKKQNLVQEITEFTPYKTDFYLEYTPYDGPGHMDAENVIAYFEGADPDLKDEAVVLMAHYDHVGIGAPDESGDGLYNGADDNGSGTTALMAIANALNEAKSQGYQPKRSILFLHVSGEENGLLGSRYYSDHPVIPIENTVTNFNADMIGRSDPENIQKGDTDYVYLIGGEIISSELDSLVQSANNLTVNMRLDRKYNDLQDSNQFYRRSDHWNFGRFGVPFVFFFTGVHEDYHRPSDTIDKINFEKLSRVSQLIYTSTIKVANYDGRPVVDNQQFIEITRLQSR